MAVNVVKCYEKENSNEKQLPILKHHILLACTGSVASIKTPDILKELCKLKYKVDVKVIATERACHFFDTSTLPVKVLKDQHEWEWEKRGDPVLHIELRRWADVLVIAPLSANTLAKISNGICDNLLTCVTRAWDPKRPLLFAPAMNTYMWDHPLTQRQIETLKSFGYTEIPCIEKTLICGDKEIANKNSKFRNRFLNYLFNDTKPLYIGFGAMAEVATIVKYVEELLEKINGIT